MNIWMGIAIPALVTVAALALLEVWTLWNWQRDRRMNTMLIDHDTENKQLRTERNELRKQVEQYGTDATAQARRIDACLRERDEAIHQCNALQLKIDEALKKPARPPRSNSRAKPPAQE